MAVTSGRELLFLVLFVASLGVNIYFLIIRADDGKDPDDYFPTHCDDNQRYSSLEPGGGRGIYSEEAAQAIRSFEESNPHVVRGYLFSKKAIDRLFDQDASANVLHIMMGIERDENICIIGVTNSNTTDISIQSDHKFIVAEKSCPTSCMDL